MTATLTIEAQMLMRRLDSFAPGHDFNRPPYTQLPVILADECDPTCYHYVCYFDTMFTVLDCRQMAHLIPEYDAWPKGAIHAVLYSSVDDTVMMVAHRYRPAQPICECGGRVSNTTHSTWCPVFGV